MVVLREHWRRQRLPRGAADAAWQETVRRPDV